MEYRDCNLCGDRQEVTPEALIAWADMILMSAGDRTDPCLCTECYWRLKKNG